MTDIATHEILSALLDREPVDPERLAAALERPDGRSLLVDFVRLRSVLHADAAEAVVPAATAAATARRSPARTMLAIAAALLLVTAGAVVGSRFGAAETDRPPEPTRVIRLVPASDGGAR